ncbi:MAG: hypothetical protein SGILL_001938 [Bacillariaceae sp.]
MVAAPSPTSSPATVKLHFVLDQCKFYPIHRRGVLAGTITSIAIECDGDDDVDDDNDEGQREKYSNVQTGDRCLVYYSEDDVVSEAVLDENTGPRLQLPPAAPPTIAKLMKRWGASECGSQKCTKWIRLVLPQHVSGHFFLAKTAPTRKEMKHRKPKINMAIGSSDASGGGGGLRNPTTTLEPKACWIFENCIHVVTQDEDEDNSNQSRSTHPSTFDLTFSMEKYKFYSTKLMVMDGTATAARLSTTSVDAPSEHDIMLPHLTKGERCHVHLRSNIKSLLKQLQGGGDESSTFVNQDYDSTGWIQFTTSLLVTCRILILPSYFKNSGNGSVIVDLPRDAKKEGTVMIECEKVLEIQPSHSPATVRRLGDRSFKSSGCGGGATEKDNGDHSLPALQDRSERQRIFAKWLVDKFGVDFLSSGSGVLDVAGGKGELCRALFDLGVQNATLLDPDPRCDPGSVPFQVIGKALRGDASDLTASNKGDDERTSKLIRSCSLIAGMHPDGATEAIVDLSLQLGVPFAILPCCYSRKIFDKPPFDPNSTTAIQNEAAGSTRKIVDQHQSYSIFCQSLLEKAPVGICFQVENLPFQGRNKLIYFDSYFCQLVSQ